MLYHVHPTSDLYLVGTLADNESSTHPPETFAVQTTPHAPIAQRLLRQCRELLECDLGEWIQEVGALIAEEVFELANTTMESARQGEYLRLRSEVQVRWQTLVDAFCAQLARDLQPMRVVDSRPPLPRSLDEMQLVDDAELTARIVMQEFVGRMSEACAEEMYALDRRMALVMGQDDFEAQGNRFAPRVLCSAIHSGVVAMLESPAERSLLMRQLERHLKTELPSLYRAINEILIDGGILPELKRHYRRNAGHAGNADHSPTDSAAILQTLQRLAQARMHTPDAGAPGQAPLHAHASSPQAGTELPQLPPSWAALTAASAAAPSPFMTAPQLADGGSCPQPLSALALPAGSFLANPAFSQSLLQLQQQLAQASPAAPGTAANALPGLDAAGLSGQAINLVRLARDSEAARQAPPLDAITMDIVATLFDLIFDDDRLPAAVKGMVSRLQIPVLKVALIDQRFFAERNHPVRRFLDSISGITQRWGNHVSEGDPFYRKLSELVERIQNGFDEDVGIFTSALNELSEFVNQHESAEEATTQVLAEVVQRQEQALQAQQERHAAAAQATSEALQELLPDATDVPRPIVQFLQGHWRCVLEQLARVQGIGSAPFKTAQRIASELIWSVTPMTQPQERARLGALLPKLLPALHQGLNQIELGHEARQPFFDALIKLHSAALHADKRTLRKAPELTDAATQLAAPPQTTPSLQVDEIEADGMLIESIALQAPATPASAASTASATHATNGGESTNWLRRVKHLVRGDWVEFVDADGVARRERLTWLSPQRSLLLFSNHATHCAISITPDALAHRLAAGSARLVEIEAPMFERALNGAIKALDQAA